MGATTIPHATGPQAPGPDAGDTTRRSGWEARSIIGTLFLATAAVDGVFVGIAALMWILEPTSAPSWDAVVALPFLALAVLTMATVVRRRLPDDNRSADLLAATARWWSLFGLLLSVPAMLIIRSL